MSWLRQFLFRFLALFRRQKMEEDMAKEMRLHLDERIHRNIEAGMAKDEARYAAARAFGGVAQIAERARDQWRSLWLEQLGQDLRYGARMLRKTPGFTLVVVLTLALGLGVNAALFAVYELAVLRPLPSRAPEELVDIRARHTYLRGVDSRFSYPDYLDYSAQSQSFSDLVAVSELRQSLEAGAGLVRMQAVSGNYFSALGAKIFLGRSFLPDEAGTYSAQPVIVVSHLFWQTYLRGDAGVLGATLTLRDPDSPTNPTAYTIIGVAAPEFLGQSLLTPAGWIPLATQPGPLLRERERKLVSLVGRMKPGVSPSQAKAELDTITRGLAQLYPNLDRANSVRLTPGMRLLDVEIDPELVLRMTPLWLGFGLTLAIACLNVANQLLARGVTRQHEIGVRLTLGAGRSRIVRQLFVENFLLCLIGAAAALLLAIWTLQALRPVLMSMLADSPEARNYVSQIKFELNGRILGFGAFLTVVAGLTAGLAPALQTVRRDGMFALKHDGSVFGRWMSPSRLRGFLLVSQVAACVTMLVVSALLSGFLDVDIADSGIAMDGLYRMKPADIRGAGSLLAHDPLRAVETLRTIPGVAAAGMGSETPLRKGGDNFRVLNIKATGGVSTLNVRVFGDTIAFIPYSEVSPGYFDTFGLPLRRGRTFSADEMALGAPVVIVSEALAEALWPGQDPVGKELWMDRAAPGRSAQQPLDPSRQSFRAFDVIGVAAGIRQNWSIVDPKRLVWFPFPAKGDAGTLFVRLRTDSTEMRRHVEQMAAAADVPVEFQEKLATIVERGLWPFRIMSWAGRVLSGLALAMATLGLYGMMSFGVNNRVREIGVRMALGAAAGQVTALFVRQGMQLVTRGVAIGAGASVLVALLLTAMMPGFGLTRDMAFVCLAFATVTVLVFAVTAIACWLPARRATKIDPMVALRVE